MESPKRKRSSAIVKCSKRCFRPDVIVRNQSGGDGASVATNQSTNSSDFERIEICNGFNRVIR